MNNESKLDQSIEYNKKIVVFFDILGFKDLIENNLQNPEFVNDVLNTAYLSSEQPFANCEVIKFSDSVIQILDPKSPTLDDNEFFYYINNIMEAVNRVQLKILRMHKVVIRGAIVLGDIYFNAEKNTIFGPALNKAAELEGKAKYPRVILDESIFNKLDKEKHELVFSNFTLDEDEVYYADPFQFIAKTESEKRELPIFKAIVEEIINALTGRNAIDSVLDKYYWLLKKIEEREREDFVAAKERLRT